MPAIDSTFLHVRISELEAEVKRLELETARAQGALRFCRFLSDQEKAPATTTSDESPMRVLPSSE